MMVRFSLARQQNSASLLRCWLLFHFIDIIHSGSARLLWKIIPEKSYRRPRPRTSRPESGPATCSAQAASREAGALPLITLRFQPTWAQDCAKNNATSMGGAMVVPGPARHRPDWGIRTRPGSLPRRWRRRAPRAAGSTRSRRGSEPGRCGPGPADRGHGPPA